MKELKQNRTGSLKIQNGRLAIDTGANVYYTELVGATDEQFTEAIAGIDQQDVGQVKGGATFTADLEVRNGNFYAIGHGYITLTDVDK